MALIPVATEVDALVTVAVLVALLVALIAYERVRFAELRERLRHGAASRAHRAGARRRTARGAQ